MSRSDRYLALDTHQRFLLSGSEPLLFAHAPDGARQCVRIAPTVCAVRVPDELLSKLGTESDAQLTESRAWWHHHLVGPAVALLRHRERYCFHPADGSPLIYPEGGPIARSATSGDVFPRIDPAVIGLVRLRGTSRILVARNRQRPQYYSLIAGYVEVGETLEHAFEREVWEETSRRVHDVTYWGSRPWPISGSLMVGFESVTEDEAPVGETDHELWDIRWADPEDLKRLPLPSPGSLAYDMLRAVIQGAEAYTRGAWGEKR